MESEISHDHRPNPAACSAGVGWLLVLGCEVRRERPWMTGFQFIAAYLALLAAEWAAWRLTDRRIQRELYWKTYILIHYRRLVIMALPQNILDDLSTLEADATAATQATAAKATTAAALVTATTDDQNAATALTGAQATQAAALAKVKADLDAVYGTTPT